PAEREEFKARLLEHFYGSSTNVAHQIRTLQLKQNRVLSAEETRIKNDNDNKPDPRLKVAAAVALLLLSGDLTKLPSDSLIAKRTIEVPPHQLTVETPPVLSSKAALRGRSYTVDAPRTAAQNLRLEELLTLLKLDVTDKSDPPRRMVTADLLVRAGARTPLSYSSVLRDTLSSSNKEDRASAILQLGPVVSSIMLMETAMALKGPAKEAQLQSVLSGNSSSELMDALRKVASSDSDKDLRALAGSILHSVRTTHKIDELHKLIQMHGRDYLALKGKPGEFAASFTRQMTNDRRIDAAGNLNAVLTLRDLGDIGGMSDNRKFNAVLADTMSAREPQVSLLALRELKITDPNKDLDPKTRQKILRLLDEATTKENELLKIAIADRIGQLAVDKEEMNSVASVLKGMIDPCLSRFAEYFPEARITAIKALTALNRREASTLILQRTNPASEDNAKVRAASVKALREMNVPGLYEHSLNALKVEEDPATRAAWLLIRSEKYRPVRNSSFLEEVQKLEAKLMESQENNPSSGKQWLDDGIKDGAYTRFRKETHDTCKNLAEEKAKTYWNYLTSTKAEYEWALRSARKAQD
ncbi:MAG: HEAT repeat domain-containing protein, partial [Cyanobacteria bacterium]|nr:HEAT repeat domain-containing protein [Cyanobacteriota bacterium]